jgi:predicted polyphosphate/ATP-dependent NAD kinase
MEIKADKRINSLKRLNKTIQNEFIRLESSSHVSRKKLRSLIESHAVYDNLLSASYQSKNKFLDSLEVILNEMDYARIREQRGIANAVNDIAGSVLIDGSVLMIDDEKNSKLLKLPIESINDN